MNYLLWVNSGLDSNKNQTFKWYLLNLFSSKIFAIFSVSLRLSFNLHTFLIFKLKKLISYMIIYEICLIMKTVTTIALMDFGGRST